jgi:hypothetical protein
MQRSTLLCTIAILLAAAPALTGQRGHVAAGPPPKAVHAAPPPHAHGAAAAHRSGATKTHAASKTNKTNRTTTTKRSRTSTSTTGTLSPVQQKLARNTNLAAKLQVRLPAGTNLLTASSGFRNLGQFVAAVNVSNNLGIPFAQLKTRMVDDRMSLGQSIQALRPSVDSQFVVKRAERDGDLLIRSTETTTTKTTPVTPRKPTVRTKAKTRTPAPAGVLLTVK